MQKQIPENKYVKHVDNFVKLVTHLQIVKYANLAMLQYQENVQNVQSRLQLTVQNV